MERHEFESAKAVSLHQASQRFMDHLGAARLRLAEIETALDNHLNAESEHVHWGHVGDAEYLVQQLTEITDRLYQRGEYSD